MLTVVVSSESAFIRHNSSRCLLSFNLNCLVFGRFRHNSFTPYTHCPFLPLTTGCSFVSSCFWLCFCFCFWFWFYCEIYSLICRNAALLQVELHGLYRTLSCPSVCRSVCFSVKHMTACSWFCCRLVCRLPHYCQWQMLWLLLLTSLWAKERSCYHAVVFCGDQLTGLHKHIQFIINSW